jgi:hypothetical protein
VEQNRNCQNVRFGQTRPNARLTISFGQGIAGRMLKLKKKIKICFPPHINKGL